MPRKLAKITRIFSKIENVKSQRVTYWPKKNWTGTSHAIELQSWLKLIEWEIVVQFSGQNVPLNILTISLPSLFIF